MKQFHIIKSGVQSGPYTEEEVIKKASLGELNSGDLCWTEGMPEWKILNDVVNLPKNIPPPPPGALHQSSVCEKTGVPEYVKIPTRSRSFITFAAIFSLGIYSIWLTAKNAQEIAFLTKKRRLDVITIVVLSIVTLGVFSMVYQIILSYDLQDYSKKMETKGRNAGLHIMVLCGNIIAFLTIFLPGLTLISVTILFPAIVLWEVQKELNLYSN